MHIYYRPWERGSFKKNKNTEDLYFTSWNSALGTRKRDLVILKYLLCIAKSKPLILCRCVYQIVDSKPLLLYGTRINTFIFLLKLSVSEEKWEFRASSGPTGWS